MEKSLACFSQHITSAPCAVVGGACVYLLFESAACRVCCQELHIGMRRREMVREAARCAYVCVVWAAMPAVNQLHARRSGLQVSIQAARR
jgi:hypothetical protein